MGRLSAHVKPLVKCASECNSEAVRPVVTANEVSWDCMCGNKPHTMTAGRGRLLLVVVLCSAGTYKNDGAAIAKRERWATVRLV